MDGPEPGAYAEVPFDAYLAWPYVSSSRLRAMAMSPAHYRAAMEKPRQPSDAQRQGAFLHCAVLEHSQIGKRYVAEPEFDIRRADGTDYANPKATREYKDRYAKWLDAVGDREPVPAEWLEQAALINRQALDHPLLRPLIMDGAKCVEESLVFDTRQGIRCKARPDLWVPHRRVIVDLKTTRSLMRFENEIARYGYHVQAAFYCRAAQVLTGEPHEFVIAAVEKEPPFGLRAAPVDPEAIRLGGEQIGQWLEQLAECMERNFWPGPASPEVWNLPSWVSGMEAST